ncbi:CRISPR-associated protein Csx16 [Ignatzschineria ureiclastica]|uniref:CRISPR-associated protein Csx16 n=1 Tax=Ignatzschineria ureiclastica TaxID=472582 RepID=A0A2U2AEZ5_9GAMM|nr:CRISPR-associated protein Csx16 [Ignatzschineria ureiclastica]PWD81225.1 CRISPR-associated protein Csx16 [Ignatzschineria ureiclastica]GGZ97270.1 hypothetical protein GCM10007162_11780 [Ignatzschineria ureiclastica]
MAVWFVSRHVGAIEWMQKQEMHVDHWVTHLDLAQIHPGDIVIGILPLSIVAVLTAHNVRYFALILPQSPSDRGQEHSCEAMFERGAYLQEFHVTASQTGLCL